MDKWTEYKTYNNWKYSNESELKRGYEERQEKYYTWVMPDTYISFDEYCMGQWQSL